MLGAAADTTGNAMNFATIEVTNNPVFYKRLCAELRVAFPDPDEKLDFLKLEKLPFLVSDFLFADGKGEEMLMCG